MSAYAKALVPLVTGIVLVVLGVILPDDTLRALGYGALGSSLVVWRVPNSTNTGTQVTQGTNK